MQFNVIVEGAINGIIPGEESLAELQRYLRSTNSPQQLIHRLSSGKPFVIKKSLSYEQAIEFSDRLFDFGLETFIDPPIKPEAEQAPAEIVATAANGNNVIVTTPHASSAASGAMTPKSILSTAAAKTNSLHNVSHTQSAQTSMASRQAASNKVPTQNKVHAQTPANNTTRKSSFTANSNVVNINHHKKKTNTASLTARQQNTTNSQTKRTANSNPALQKAAEEVKALFSSHSRQSLSPEPSNRARLKAYSLAGLSILFPAVYFGITLAFIAATLALFIAGVSALQNIIPIPLAIVLVLLPTLLLTPIIAMLVLPLLNSFGSTPSNGIALQTRDEPKLFMLISALSQLLRTPMPNKVEIVAEPIISCQIKPSIKDFLTLNKALSPETSLSLGAPLLRSLSIQSVVAGIVPEIARHSDKKTHRAQCITNANRNWLKHCQNSDLSLSSLTKKIAFNYKLEKSKDFLKKTANLMERFEHGVHSYFGFCEKTITKLNSPHNSNTTMAQIRISGDTTSALHQEDSEKLRALFEKCTDKLINKNPKNLYVDNLPDLIDSLYKGSNSAKKQENSSSVIIQSAKPINTWLNQTSTYCQDSSTLFYQQQGLDTEAIDLISTTELANKQKQDSHLKKTSEDYFYKWLNPKHFWKIPEETTIKGLNKRSAIDRLDQCIDKIRYLTPDRINAINEIEKVKNQVVELRVEKKLAAMSNDAHSTLRGEPSKNLDNELSIRNDRLKSATEDLQRYNTVMGERIFLGVALNNKNSQAGKIIGCLRFFAGAEEKTSKLVMTTKELEALTPYKSKKANVHLDLYLKELSKELESGIKSILKRARLCPYEFLNPRHENLANFLHSTFSECQSNNPTSLLIEKSHLLQKVLRQIFVEVNQLAADIAAKSETVNSIKKIKQV